MIEQILEDAFTNYRRVRVRAESPEDNTEYTLIADVLFYDSKRRVASFWVFQCETLSSGGYIWRCHTDHIADVEVVGTVA